VFTHVYTYTRTHTLTHTHTGQSVEAGGVSGVFTHMYTHTHKHTHTHTTQVKVSRQEAFQELGILLFGNVLYTATSCRKYTRALTFLHFFLGIVETASEDEIRAAYKKLAREVVDVYVYVCVCVCVCLPLSLTLSLFVSVSVSMSVSLCVSVSVCLCLCVCVFVFIFFSPSFFLAVAPGQESRPNCHRKISENQLRVSPSHTGPQIIENK